MYLPPDARSSSGTPLKYTVKARDAIHQTLFNSNNNTNNNGTLINNNNNNNNVIQPSSHVLKYGSSPLLNSINASQLQGSDSASINSTQSEDEEPNKKKKKLFGNFSFTRHNSNDLVLNRTESHQSVDSVPTSTMSSNRTDSLFSRQLTQQMTNTTIGSSSMYGLSQPMVINLEDAMPSDFKDMYSNDTLIDTLPNGRPRFTQRDIVDWQLNDIRSLLIIDDLKKEWMGQVPIIKPVGHLHFKIQVIKLNSSDEDIIRALVESDLYKETNFHLNFKIKTATFIISTIRQKHLMMLKKYYQLQDNSSYDEQLINTPLLKYELRNIIENYLLNLGVETQCRANFKQSCLILKKQKLQLFNLNEDFDKNKNLLKTALINNSNLFLNLPNIDKNSIKLSRDEKLKIWNITQLEVYQKLNLDWQPDNIG